MLRKKNFLDNVICKKSHVPKTYLFRAVFFYYLIQQSLNSKSQFADVLISRQLATTHISKRTAKAMPFLSIVVIRALYHVEKCFILQRLQHNGSAVYIGCKRNFLHIA